MMNQRKFTKFDGNMLWYLAGNEDCKTYSKQMLNETLSGVCQERNIKFVEIRLEEIVLSVENDRLQVTVNQIKVEYLPLVIVIRIPPRLSVDSHITVIHHLELLGCRLINSSAAIMRCVNKMWTLQELANRGLPLPNTYSYGCRSNPLNALDSVEDELGYPLVVKNVKGCQGRQVFLARDSCMLHETLPVLKHDTPYLFQQYIRESHGRDVRVIVVGGKVIGAMLRQSADGRMQSNCAAGGSGTAFNLSPEGEKLALEVAHCLGLDYCGIDLLLSGQNFYVCEVNANAGFERFNSALGINVAERISEFALAELARLRSEVHSNQLVSVVDSESTSENGKEQ